jgi:hypothetical protein
MSPPPVPLEERHGEVVGFPFFNLDAVDGFYKIDSFKSYIAGAAPFDHRNRIVPPYLSTPAAGRLSARQMRLTLLMHTSLPVTRSQTSKNSSA